MSNTNILFANNASSTLASGIGAGATTVTLQAGDGALFPSPVAGQYFCLSFQDAATGLVREITHCTSRTTDTLTIVRAQEGTSAHSWLAGDVAANWLTAGSFAATAGRTPLTTATTFYVNASTGNDGNNGLTSGAPWLTIQHAINIIASVYDLAGFTATIQLADGTYAGCVVPASILGNGNAMLIINGNNATPTNVIISGGASSAVAASGPVSLQNLKVQTTSGGAVALLSTTGGEISISGPLYFGATSGVQMRADNGLIFILNAYVITGGATAHMLSTNNGVIEQTSGAIAAHTVSGTPAFSSAFAIAQDGGVLNVPTALYSGGATGQRYLVSANGVIDTAGGGANFFPGNVAGAASTGGQYV